MRVLIAGAGGFIGSHVVEQAVTAGHTVRGVVLPGEDASLLRELGVEILVGDLVEPDIAQRAVAGCDVIFNTMGNIDIYESREKMFRANVWATENLIQAAAAEGVRRMVMASSYLVSLGGSFHYWNGGLITEQPPHPPRYWRWDYYAETKVAAERALLEAHERGLLETVPLRLGWVYGSRNRYSFTVLVEMLRNSQLMIIGNGSNRLALVHGADVARAFLLAAGPSVAPGRPYLVEGLAGRPTVTQADYLNGIADMVGASRPGRRVPFGAALAMATAVETGWHLLGKARPPMSSFIVHLLGRHQPFDTTRARSELGWEPRVTFEEGMQETLAWFDQEQADVLAKEVTP